MRKILSMVAVMMSFGLLFAQDGKYSRVEYYNITDKLIRKEKTEVIITKTDSSFIFEQEGVKKRYIVLSRHSPHGNKDSLMCLTNDSVFGFEMYWIAVDEDDFGKYLELERKFLNDGGYEELDKLHQLYYSITYTVYSSSPNEYRFKGDCLNISHFFEDDERLGKGVGKIVFYTE